MSTSIFRMASNHSTGTAHPHLETSRPTTVPIEVYIVSYDAKEWRGTVSLLDGRQPPDADWGSLGAYQSPSLAQDTGIEWALKQLQDRLQRHNPPLEKEEDRDAAFDQWDKSESTQGDSWSYTISKGNERLLTKVQKMTLYDRHRHRSTND